MRRLNAKSGFSVTELVIVIAAGLIITAIALPIADTALDQYNLVLSAQAVTNQMQYTRMRAVSSNEALRLRFPTRNSYQVELENGALHTGPFNYSRGIVLNDAGGDAVTFPGDELLFLPNGALPLTGTGSAGRLRLTNGDGLRIDIVVDSGGMIRMTPAYRSASPPF